MTDVERLAKFVVTCSWDDVSEAARDELSGSTITITSLGPIGGLVSTPVINYPEVESLGVNRIVERPVGRGGQIWTRQMRNPSSPSAHRVGCGGGAARAGRFERQGAVEG